MMLFPASNDLLTLFVALEVLSLPLYLLSRPGPAPPAARQEAALKYFLLGAFSSAFFLYGVALLYGYSGSHVVRGDRYADQGTATSSDVLLIGGLALVVVGLLFKVGAVPFHRGRRTSTRALRRPSPLSWRPAPRSRRSAPCCGSYVAFGPSPGAGSRCSGVDRHRDDGRRRGDRRSPRPT